MVQAALEKSGVANMVGKVYNSSMTSRKCLTFLMSLMLMVVSFASVSVAAGNGMNHDSHAEAAVMDNHHDMANMAMMDCPSHKTGHNDGLKMQDAKCAVACFAMIPVAGWHGVIMSFPDAVKGEMIGFANILPASRSLHIPTPPPNFV
jgi:hypothetical protein